MSIRNEAHHALVDFYNDFLSEEFSESELRGMLGDLKDGNQPVDHETDLVEEHLGELRMEREIPERETLEKIVVSVLIEVIEYRTDSEKEATTHGRKRV